MKKEHIKFFIFPIIILLIVLFFASFNIHGSSIGEFHKILYPGHEDTNLIFGQSRGIRSDEWMAGTPQIVSQIRNNLPIINEDIATGMNLAYGYGAPTESIFTLFKPQLWIFLLTDNIAFAFSFFWWFRIAILILSFYLLLLELTNKNILLSILGSILLYFTPFIQWWLGFDTITMISFSLYFFLLIMRKKFSIRHIFYTIGLTFSLTSFALILYPPFQIPLAWIAFFLGIGVFLHSLKDLLANKKDTLIKLSLLFLSITIVFFVIYSYFKIFSDVISLMTETSYPGERFIAPGLGDIRRMLSGFFNILLQMNSNGVPFGNQSEASNFFILSPFLILWVLYMNIKTYINKKLLDWVGIALTAGFAFLLSWYLLPLPEIFSKLTFLYMVTPERLIIAFGISNYLFIVHMLSSKFYIPSFKNRFDIMILTIITGITAYTYFRVGDFLYNLNPNFFYWPQIMSADLKILGVVIFSSALIPLIVYRNKLSLYLLIIFGILSTLLINPLYKGFDILTETPLAKEIQILSSQDDSRWIIYGNYVYSHYILANGGRVMNGMHNYPQFDMWKIIDPEKEYYDLYNRFAHIFFSEYIEGENLVQLNQNDAVEINMNPCDIKLQNLGVKYLLSTIELKDNYCLEKIDSFQGATIYRIKR